MSLPALPFTIYSRNSKKLFLLFGSVAFVTACILVALQGHMLGWLCAGLFGLGIPMFLTQLVNRKTSCLTVSEEGIEIGSIFNSRKIRWSDISHFGTYKIRHNVMVGFDYSSDYQRSLTARRISKALAGFEGALPDTYGYHAEQLAEMLADYHAIWGQTSKPTPDSGELSA